MGRQVTELVRSKQQQKEQEKDSIHVYKRWLQMRQQKQQGSVQEKEQQRKHGLQSFYQEQCSGSHRMRC